MVLITRLEAPLAGAWIEIIIYVGEGNLLLPKPLSQGRELKFGLGSFIIKPIGEAPLAGAWIEMRNLIRFWKKCEEAPLAGAWIEIRIWEKFL